MFWFIVNILAVLFGVLNANIFFYENMIAKICNNGIGLFGFEDVFRKSCFINKSQICRNNCFILVS